MYGLRFRGYGLGGFGWMVVIHDVEIGTEVRGKRLVFRKPPGGL